MNSIYSIYIPFEAFLIIPTETFRVVGDDVKLKFKKRTFEILEIKPLNICSTVLGTAAMALLAWSLV